MNRRNISTMSSRLKIVLAVIACLIITFAVGLRIVLASSPTEPTDASNGEYAEWLRYVEANVEPYRAKLRAAESSDEFIYNETLISTVSDYQITVGSPSQEEPVGDGNEGYVIIQLFRDDGFRIFVWRYLDHPATYSVSITIANDENGMHWHGSFTDSEGNVLPRHPEDIEELYLRWLEAIEENNDVIQDMFDTARYIFEDLW